MLIKLDVTTVKILQHIERTVKKNLQQVGLIKATVTTVNILRHMAKL